MKNRLLDIVHSNINFIPEKKFSQNFLIERTAINSITNIVLCIEAAYILEIGPGDGALSKLLLQDGRPLIAVDIDTRSIQSILKQFGNYKNLYAICGSILDVPFIFNKSLSIVGNLPYNISTAILIHILLQFNFWEQMVLMFQLEVGRKIVSQINTKQYGPLSILTQLICDVGQVCKLPPTAFYPMPKVYSIVLVFQRRAFNMPIGLRYVFLSFLYIGFTYRRKTLVNNLRGLFNESYIVDALKAIKYPNNVRAECIDPSSWVNLFYLIWK